MRLAVTTAVRIVPEEERHRRHGSRDDEFADIVDDAIAGFIERRNCHASFAALNLAGGDWQRRCAGHETGSDVGTAAH